jgi:trimethylamine--corrinoid protein Co-methyltransferase
MTEKRRQTERPNRRNRTARQSSTIRQPPFTAVRNPYPPYRVISDDQVAQIHLRSLELLRDIGMRVSDDRALDLLAKKGADVNRDTRQVRFDDGLITEMLQKLPDRFTLHARNPARTLEMGGDAIAFATVSGPSFVSDLDRGRRAGTYEDVCNFVKLTHSLNIFHHEGGAGLEPLDLPAASRHLDMMYAQLTLTDKAWYPCWLNSAKRSRDCIEMACISQGVSEAELAERPAFIAGINTNSPLVLDGAMSDGLIEMALAGQPTYVCPFTLAGAMSPVTLAGSLLQQNAEVLAGFMVSQAAKPGAPVIYGHFTSNVDMRSGAPAFGTPEYAKSLIASAQMARFYNVPFRSSNTTASAAPDVQAAYESEMSCWSAMLAHTNVVLHAGGWLEGGLVCSFEKLIMDAEMLQMLAAFLEPIAMSEEDFGMEAIRDVGPGGHFFGTQHTLDRYETEFYEPMLSDWRNFETWHDDGARTATERANGIWKQLLNDYEQPPLDPAVDEELKAYMANRKEEIAATGE